MAESEECIRVPRSEAERVLTALAIYANVEEYKKENRERARSIRSTARGIALQLAGVDSSSDTTGEHHD